MVVPDHVKKDANLEVNLDYDKKLGRYRHSFDLTTFPNRSSFQDLLERFNLTDYNRVKVDEMFNGNPVYQYCWSTPHNSIVLVTSNNPISGKYSQPEERSKEIGYASYVGVSAKHKRQAAQLVLAVETTAEHVKDSGQGFTQPRRQTLEELEVVEDGQ